jgi:hypothetical protein
MATQSNVSVGGRNRNARKGSETPAALNIGHNMTPKDQTPAVNLTPQADPKGVEGIKLDRKTLDSAAKIVGRFHDASTELQTLKDEVDAKRGGLSDICFQLAKLGAHVAPKPEQRWAACVKVFESAEAWERQRFQKQNKLAEIPTAREALGASWQTYKSQILKCVAAGLNPEDFANGTVFREAMSQTGNKARRGARQTAGTAAGVATMTGVLESAPIRAELSAAIADLVKHVQALTEEMQLEYANKVHRISLAAARETLADKGEEAGEQANVATM